MYLTNLSNNILLSSGKQSDSWRKESQVKHLHYLMYFEVLDALCASEVLTTDEASEAPEVFCTSEEHVMSAEFAEFPKLTLGS